MIVSVIQIDDQVRRLENEHRILKAYLGLLVEREDWFGVAEICGDLREVAAKISFVRQNIPPM